jgi:hypothetical protein
MMIPQDTAVCQVNRVNLAPPALKTFDKVAPKWYNALCQQTSCYGDSLQCVFPCDLVMLAGIRSTFNYQVD